MQMNIGAYYNQNLPIKPINPSSQFMYPIQFVNQQQNFISTLQGQPNYQQEYDQGNTNMNQNLYNNDSDNMNNKFIKK